MPYPSFTSFYPILPRLAHFALSGPTEFRHAYAMRGCSSLRELRPRHATHRSALIGTYQPQTKGVLVTVRDSGPGIDPRHREFFRRFYTTKHRGGMGLAISWSIIKAYGERLWVDANERGGAVFQFTLSGAEVNS
jgi:signal transduction histidine kinase